MNKDELVKKLTSFEGHVLIDNNFTFFKVSKVLVQPDRYENQLRSVRKYKYLPFIKERRIVSTFVFGSVTILYQRNTNVNSEGREAIACNSIKELHDWYKAFSDSWTRLQNIKSDLITFNVSI